MLPFERLYNGFIANLPCQSINSQKYIGPIFYDVWMAYLLNCHNVYECIVCVFSLSGVASS